jgi:HPr kinase/phosphorylase
MTEEYSVLLSQLVKEHELEVAHASESFDEERVRNMAVSRPGLQFAGFFEYYDPCRMLVYGKQEHTYLERLSPEERYGAIEGLLKRKPCALVICHGVELFPELLALADKYDVSVFASKMDTSEFMARLISSLHIHLAPRRTIHGVLVEVYGEGLLITGDSGIGKSETALELIKRGHRLIADDAVEIKKISHDELVGESPQLIRHFMEFRGIGIINARYIYGIGAVKASQTIHMVIKLENWEDGKAYDRLGADPERAEILGIEVPAVTIPVRPGRNLAVILELAAMNNRQKKLGYNAAQELERMHDHFVDQDLF